nr:4Fe-4S binding protein [Candidatus Sigynarchaeota archaeon]
MNQELQYAQKTFLVESVRLEIDRTKCKNCGTCVSACPNNVIKRGIPGKHNPVFKERLPVSVILDPETCSYCGTCAYMCPFDALKLVVDGVPVPRDELQLARKHALPRIIAEEVTLKDGATGKKFIEGYLKHDREQCQEGCNICHEACPTGTNVRYEMLKSSFNPASKHGVVHRWVPEVLQIDRDKCIQCGACAFACPVSAIQIFRQKLHVDGEFQDPFWPDTLKRILDYHTQQE